MSLQWYPNHKSKHIAGCDEVGRGCLAGPVVAAAVILKHGKIHPDLRDSKKLNRDKIVEVASWIRANSEDYAITLLNAAEIDYTNILRSSIKAMHISLSKLRKSPDLIIVDGNKFYPYQDVPHKCVIKGDGVYYSIAAASILAKDARDRFMELMDNWYPKYDWKKNVGYPTPRHKQALVKLGPTPFHRKTFKGVISESTLFHSNFKTDID